MPALRDAFVVNTQSTSSVNANAPAGTATTEVSNFVTAQSLSTFAIATPVLKLIWDLLKGLAGGWADSYWTPLVICGIYGLWQLVISFTGQNSVSGFSAVTSAVVTGVANSAILAASIIGITETTGVGDA